MARYGSRRLGPAGLLVVASFAGCASANRGFVEHSTLAGRPTLASRLTSWRDRGGAERPVVVGRPEADREIASAGAPSRPSVRIAAQLSDRVGRYFPKLAKHEAPAENARPAARDDWAEATRRAMNERVAQRRPRSGDRQLDPVESELPVSVRIEPGPTVPGAPELSGRPRLVSRLNPKYGPATAATVTALEPRPAASDVDEGVESASDSAVLPDWVVPRRAAAGDDDLTPAKLPDSASRDRHRFDRSSVLLAGAELPAREAREFAASVPAAIPTSDEAETLLPSLGQGSQVVRTAVSETKLALKADEEPALTLPEESTAQDPKSATPTASAPAPSAPAPAVAGETPKASPSPAPTPASGDAPAEARVMPEAQPPSSPASEPQKAPRPVVAPEAPPAAAPEPAPAVAAPKGEDTPAAAAAGRATPDDRSPARTRTPAAPAASLPTHEPVAVQPSAQLPAPSKMMPARPAPAKALPSAPTAGPVKVAAKKAPGKTLPAAVPAKSPAAVTLAVPRPSSQVAASPQSPSRGLADMSGRRKGPFGRRSAESAPSEGSSMPSPLGGTVPTGHMYPVSYYEGVNTPSAAPQTPAPFATGQAPVPQSYWSVPPAVPGKARPEAVAGVPKAPSKSPVAPRAALKAPAKTRPVAGAPAPAPTVAPKAPSKGPASALPFSPPPAPTYASAQEAPTGHAADHKSIWSRLKSKFQACDHRDRPDDQDCRCACHARFRGLLASEQGAWSPAPARPAYSAATPMFLPPAPSFQGPSPSVFGAAPAAPVSRPSEQVAGGFLVPRHGVYSPPASVIGNPVVADDAPGYRPRRTFPGSIAPEAGDFAEGREVLKRVSAERLDDPAER